MAAAEEKEHKPWFDSVVEEMLKRNKKEYACEGGWTPSGYFHIGNARPELFTPFFVFLSLKKAGKKARFVFMIDDFDQFDKIPKGFDLPADFEQHLGKPLVFVPSPEKGFKNWAEFFMNQIKSVVKEFGLEIDFFSAFESYNKGLYNEKITAALNNSKRIIELWNKISNAEKPADFLPIQVLCQKCKKVGTTIASNWNGKTVDYECSACGNKGTVSPLNGKCKLHWRVDWPARWSIFGVDFESCGKDHASLGGSVHTAKPICKEIFKTEPPVIKPSEFIQMHGAKMSGSVGNLVSLKQWFDVAEPELYRFMILSYKPDTAIEFDIAGNSFLLLYDRFERAERLFYKWEKPINESADAKLARAYELALIKKPLKKLNAQLQFSSAVLVSQLFDEKSWDSIAEFMKSSGNVKGAVSAQEKKQILAKLARTKLWIEKYGQNYKLKFVPLEEVNQAVIPQEAKALFPAIAQKIAKAKTAEEVQTIVYDASKANNVPAQKLFSGLYFALLNKERGPKVGSLVFAFGKEKVCERLRQIK